MGFKFFRPSPDAATDVQVKSVARESYRVLVSVRGGLHRGAAFIAPSSESVFLGSSPECDLVLMDEGVGGRALNILEQDGRLAAKVLAPGVTCQGVELALGIKVFDEPVALLTVGGADLCVELLRRSTRDQANTVASSSAQPAASEATPRRHDWAILALAGVALATTLGFAGGAVNASSSRSVQPEVRTLAGVIESFNVQGAQIVVVDGANDQPQLRGLIADAQMRAKLEREMRAAGLKAELQLNEVQQMSDSLTRLAQLGGHSCKVRHLGSGRFDCEAGVADQQAVARLQALADQVPGVVSFEVHAREPEIVAAAAVPASQASVDPQPVVAMHPRLPVILHVALGERESIAIDSTGRTLRVGDNVDGAKVVRIRFDSVDLVHEGERHTVFTTPRLAAAPSLASNQ